MELSSTLISILTPNSRIILEDSTGCRRTTVVLRVQFPLEVLNLSIPRLRVFRRVFRKKLQPKFESRFFIQFKQI